MSKLGKLGLVTCRLCGKKDIDRNVQVEGKDWVMRSRNYFYHKSCFDEWVSGKNELNSTKADNTWADYAWAYLQDEKHIHLNYEKFRAQWNSFLKKNMTSKGIYFCLKYFYDVKHGDCEKSQEGIGIVPYIYREGTQYWVAREEKEKGICARIEQQLKEKAAQRTVKIAPVIRETKRKVTISLDEI